MGRVVKKPKEQLAPAYFVQYSALWCVLLGFFVMLLSLGRTQQGPGAEGLGEVRDAFGTSGGLGMLAFAKNVVFGRGGGASSTFRIRQPSSGSTSEVDGYVRGLLNKRGLSDISNVVVVETDHGTKVVLKVPVSFRGDDYMMPESVKLFEQFAEVLVNLRQYDFEVMTVYEDAPSWAACQRSAMLRSSVVARFLTEAASLSPERIKAVGYSDSRFLDAYGMEPVKEHVLIAVLPGRR